MSNLGKIFLVVALIASLAAAVVGFLLGQDKTKYDKQLVDVERALKSAPSDLNIVYNADFKLNQAEPAKTLGTLNQRAGTVIEERDAARTELKDTKEKLASKEVENTTLQEKLTRTEGDLKSTKDKLAEAETSASEATQKLAEINKDLQGRTAKELVETLEKNKQQMQLIDDRDKTLEFENKTIVAEVERLRDLEARRANGTAPLDLSGKVVAINRAWNFVVLDVGLDNKLVEGVDLTVYRGNQLIGKIRTVEVDNKTAIADVLPDWTKAEIQVGDQVLF